jgi:alkylated DNA repair dioxygenase AlkB
LTTATQPDLFGTDVSVLPEGMRLREDFIDAAQEAALLEAIGGIALHEARYKAYTARRRICSYGTQYDYDDNRLLPAQPLAPFLLPLRERVAAWVGVDPESFGNALVAEYRPGTPLGWHRDVPDYERIAGVSLGGHARMRLRPYPPASGSPADVRVLELPPRSVYELKGVARWGWQHGILPTTELRWSITFRTLREGGPRGSRRSPE